MHHVLASSLKLLHPFMPFITDELWQGMGYGAADETIMNAPWPDAKGAVELQVWGISPEIVAYVDARHEMIRSGRMLRADCGISPAQKIDYIIKPNTAAEAAWLKADNAVIKSTLRAKELTIDEAFVPTGAVPSVVTGLGMLYMPVEGLIDVQAESAKLTKQLAEIEGHLTRVKQKLGNHSFISKAPREVVAQQEKARDDLWEKHIKVKRLLEMMK
jgi:valyl-tRNA synthetase